MYHDLGEVELKTGETVQAGAVCGPDEEWRESIEKLLEHKGGIWNWQNGTVLKSDVGIEARFYVLHRGGDPFANVMTVELEGAGIFGHVWTKPEDRRKGAMAHLIAKQMDDFRARGGKALFLGTGFDSVAYHIYERSSFRGIEPKSGCMAYYAESRTEFEAEYFAPPPCGDAAGPLTAPARRAGGAVVEDVEWRHWPSSAALFTGDFPGVVRCAPAGLIGRMSTEGPLLPLIREAAENAGEEEGHPRAVAARLESSGALVGFAAWGWDALWPEVCIVDVYCHPDHWERAAELLSRLRLPDARRHVAYADSACGEKHASLRGAGFRPEAKLEGWVAADKAKTRTLSVQVYRK